MSENSEAELKERFFYAETKLIAALNGITRDPATQDEIMELKEAIIQIQEECESHDINTDELSLWEIILDRRMRNETLVRDYAEKQKQISAILPHSKRKLLAKFFGLIVVVAILTKWLTLGVIIGTILGGFVTFLLAEIVLSELFPTPPRRIGQKACQLRVNVSDLWSKDSEDFKDYISAFRYQQWKMRICGKDLNNWRKDWGEEEALSEAPNNLVNFSTYHARKNKRIKGDMKWYKKFKNYIWRSK